MKWEKVHTVPDWYDGPRRGVADYNDKPHLFESAWNDDEDMYGDEFLLWEISQAALSIALEDWEIWRRWERAFHAGETGQATHPALPEDRVRHEELQRLMIEHGLVPANDDERLGPFNARAPSAALRLTAEFRSSGDDNGHASLQVRWMPTRDQA